MNALEWVENPLSPEFILEMLAANAYRVYRGCLIGDAPPAIQQQYERITHPVPGDVVLEISARHNPAIDRLGILASVGEEPDPDCVDNWDERDGPVPTTTCWHVVTTDGRPYRWHNAHFIQVATEAFDSTAPGSYSAEDKQKDRLVNALARIAMLRRQAEEGEHQP